MCTLFIVCCVYCFSILLTAGTFLCEKINKLFALLSLVADCARVVISNEDCMI